MFCHCWKRNYVKFRGNNSKNIFENDIAFQGDGQREETAGSSRVGSRQSTSAERGETQGITERHGAFTGMLRGLNGVKLA